MDAFLTLPGPDDRTLAGIVRKVRLLAIRILLTFDARVLPSSLGASVSRAQAALTEALRHRPEAVLDAIGNPDVLTPLLVLASDLRLPAACLADAVPPLLAGLVDPDAKTAAGEGILWDVPLGGLADARNGRVFAFDPPAESLLAGIRELQISARGRTSILPRPAAQACPEGVSVQTPFHPLGVGRLQLSLFDTNPLAMDEEHPEKTGNAVSLGGRSIGEWRDAIGAALRLIECALPEWYRELPIALERLIPVGYDDERHLSASYREAPGLAYVSLHPDPLTMAEAIVHETQHGKLNLLSWLDPVLHNGSTCWTPSPVRPDLRPLMGVLLAVHAFVPVAALHEGLARAGHEVAESERFRRRRREVLASNDRGLAILTEKADATPIGRRLLDDLVKTQDGLRAQAPKEDAAEAATSAEPGGY